MLKFGDKSLQSEFFHIENLYVNHKNHDFTWQNQAAVWAPYVKEFLCFSSSLAAGGTQHWI